MKEAEEIERQMKGKQNGGTEKGVQVGERRGSGKSVGQGGKAKLGELERAKAPQLSIQLGGNVPLYITGHTLC